MATDRKNNTLSSFTASCVKNPFYKFKRPPRNIHTMQGGFPIVEGASNTGPNDVSHMKSAGESHVSKLMRLLPGLCQIKKRLPESSVFDTSCERNSLTKNQSNDEGTLVDICPPTKKVISGKLASRKTCCTKGPRQKKKTPFNLKVMMFSTSQSLLNIGNCLNVKVSGPMHHVIGEMMGSKIKKVVTLSGAGMSTSAGIPDFRSPHTGIYDKLKEYELPYAQAIFERKYFDRNPKPLFALLKEMLAKDYKPTVAHYFVKLLEEKGLLLRHITQNVDGLERLAGVSQNKVVEAHGSVYGSRCLKCKTEYDLQWLRDRLVIQGKAVPQCQDPHCLGMVKPNIVLFGETLNPSFIASVKKEIPKCDLLIIIGTSLVVEPFASTVKKVSRSCPRIIVNNIPVGEHLGIVYEGSSEYNHKKKKSALRDVFIQGSCDEGVLHLAKLFKWESDLEALIHRYEPEIHPRQNQNMKANGSKKERTKSQNTNEPETQKYLQSVHDNKHKRSKYSDPMNIRAFEADEKEKRNSVANRAKNMWKRITSSVLTPEVFNKDIRDDQCQ